MHNNWAIYCLFRMLVEGNLFIFVNFKKNVTACVNEKAKWGVFWRTETQFPHFLVQYRSQELEHDLRNPASSGL